MRWLKVAVIGSLLGPDPAAAQSSMRKFLEGQWVGEGLQLRIDQDAVQANDNPEKPFEWSPFHIRDVTGQMVVFQIGTRQYIGFINGQQMNVTFVGSNQSYNLHKVPPQERKKQKF